MKFEYERDTRQYYRSTSVAEEYHSSFAHPKGWSGLRFKLVADRERAVVKALLLRIPHIRVLDIPAGTGKLAPVFADLGCEVLACDISPAMLAIARRTYQESGCKRAAFDVLDLKDAEEHLKEVSYDVTVCIRLMHRVPPDTRRVLLSQVGGVSRFAIVSFGIRNPYHEMRRVVRRAIFGGVDTGLKARGTRRKTEELILESHTILTRRAVVPGLSSEWIYLLEARS